MFYKKKCLLKPSVYCVPRCTFILWIADLPMPLTLIFAISSELKENIVIDNMQFHRSKRMLYCILCNGSPSSSLACYIERMSDDIALSVLLKKRAVFIWTGKVFEVVFMFHTCLMLYGEQIIKVLT